MLEWRQRADSIYTVLNIPAQSIRAPRRQSAFTILEIVIAVTVIGILAAMAIPTFLRVKQASMTAAMENDARLLAGAAQQYFLENPGVLDVALTVDTPTGRVAGSLSTYVQVISKGVTVSSPLSASGDFTMSHPLVSNGVAVTFNSDGKRVP